MKAPFKTPVTLEGMFLVDDDCELICRLTDATDAEAAEIVKRINAYDDLKEKAAMYDGLCK